MPSGGQTFSACWESSAFVYKQKGSRNHETLLKYTRQFYPLEFFFWAGGYQILKDNLQISLSFTQYSPVVKVIRKRKKNRVMVLGKQFERNRLWRNHSKRSVCCFKWHDPVCYIKSAVGTPEGRNRSTDACTSLCRCGLSQVWISPANAYIVSYRMSLAPNNRATTVMPLLKIPWLTNESTEKVAQEANCCAAPGRPQDRQRLGPPLVYSAGFSEGIFDLYNLRGCVPFLPSANASFIRAQWTRLTFWGPAFPKLRVFWRAGCCYI